MRANRRQILQRAAAASVAFPLFTIAGTKSSGRVLGANDTIRVGVAGINGRGVAHIDGLAGQSGVQITHLIDPDSSLFDARSALVEKKAGNKPTCVQDIRRALDDKNLDAITVATCNHWHSLITVWACQAGKDVYVEKPISHNVFEGRKCVEAAKKYGRVVQHGTQSRSDLGRARTMAAIHSGKYGKLLVAKGYCCKPRWSIGVKATEAPPSSLDFNLWLGPAPQQSFHRNLVHYNWHWFWDTGNGDTGNQGVHELDVARWGIKGATMPTKIWSLGGRFLPDGPDQGETPNLQLSVYEFGEVLLVFETRGLVGKKDIPTKVSNEFYTSEGVIRGGKFYPNDGSGPQDIKAPEGARVTPGGAFGSFITSIRDRKFDQINGDAETAHYSSALCHLANISFRLSERVPFNQPTKSLGDDKQVVESFEALRENLQAVDIRLDKTTYQLGRSLQFNPQTEKFVGDEEANKLLTREYRAPFVVPEKV